MAFDRIHPNARLSYAQASRYSGTDSSGAGASISAFSEREGYPRGPTCPGSATRPGSAVGSTIQHPLERSSILQVSVSAGTRFVRASAEVSTLAEREDSSDYAPYSASSLFYSTQPASPREYASGPSIILDSIPIDDGANPDVPNGDEESEESNRESSASPELTLSEHALSLLNQSYNDSDSESIATTTMSENSLATTVPYDWRFASLSSWDWDNYDDRSIGVVSDDNESVRSSMSEVLWTTDNESQTIDDMFD